MAHCIHGTHWDGISPFYCDQCAVVNPGGSPVLHVGTVTMANDPCKCGKHMLQHWWEAVTDAGNEGTDFKRHSRTDCLTRTERDRARIKQVPWVDVKDEWNDAIKAAHPARTDSHHEEYATAMQMVGNRHSKGELVALVTWLLIEKKHERERTIEEVARPFEVEHTCQECGDGEKMRPPVSLWRCGHMPHDHTTTGPEIAFEIREAAKR